MIRFILPIVLLAACAEVQQTADQLARQQAKVVVNSQVARVLPGVDISFATDCIIDTASAQEILTLASASVTGANASTGELVARIASRPESQKCIVEKSVQRLF